MGDKKEIKAFSFLDRDPRQVADEMRRAGWTREDMIEAWNKVYDWNWSVHAAFCAAEEANRGDE